MDYSNIIVNKPWGYEYLAYQNKDMALWVLYIKDGKSTSMHCHPQKNTGFVVLDGLAEVSFLAEKRVVSAVSKITIRKRLFHRIKSLSPNGCYIFEIENPNDKTDVFRMDDSYGRTFKPYEGEKFYIQKRDDCLTINEPPDTALLNYQFLNQKILVENIDNIDTINNKNDEDLVVFLKGGLFKKVEDLTHNIIYSGDIEYAKYIKQFSNQMDGVCDDTIILTLSSK